MLCLSIPQATKPDTTSTASPPPSYIPHLAQYPAAQALSNEEAPGLHSVERPSLRGPRAQRHGLKLQSRVKDRAAHRVCLLQCVAASLNQAVRHHSQSSSVL